MVAPEPWHCGRCRTTHTTVSCPQDAPPPPANRGGYTVESGIPIPEPKNRRVRYPFDEMAIGDSFAFSVIDVAKVKAAASQYRKRTGKRYTIRDLGAGTARCWRVE